MIGLDLKLESGHTLVYDGEYDDIGFLMEVTKAGETHEEVHMIGSETAWSYLRSHARKITEETAAKMAADLTIARVNSIHRNS